MTKRTQPGADIEVWSDLVVSILAVNRYPLQKICERVSGLQDEGLFSIENLGNWGVEEIGSRLKKAGMDRGTFMTALFAQRLSSLGVAVCKMGVTDATKLLLSNKRSAIAKLLIPIHGIGPQVLANFYALRQIE